MDIKRLVIGMALAMALMFGWQYFVMRQYEKHPEWKKPGETAAVSKPGAGQLGQGTAPVATSGPVAANVATTGPAATQAATQAAGTLAVQGGGTAAGAPLGSRNYNDKTYALEVSTASRGAGIDSVILNQFHATVERKEPYVYEEPFTGTYADASRPLATQWVSLNGQKVDLGGVDWKLENKSDHSATYVVEVGSGDAAVRVRKTYEVLPIDAQPAGSMGYEIHVTQTVENAGKRPVNVATEINGPVSPVREIDSVDDRQVIGGYKSGESMVAVGHAFNTFTAEKPSLDLTEDKNKNKVVWVGASSVYFDAIARPLPAGTGEGESMPLKAVTAESLNAGQIEKKEYDKNLVKTGLTTSEVALSPGNKATLPIYVFFGPKKRDLLNNQYYSAVPLGYDSTLSTNQSSCGTYCTFGWLINLLVEMLRGFHFVFRDWGLAIIALVAIVRIALHPITKRSQVSMVKMGKMGPEIERLKKKYADNKEELNKAMMTVYKEQGFTPVLGCLPMFLQMPIWIALYACLQNTFELRHAGFLWFGNWGLTWIHDLAKPDRFVYFPNHPLNLWFFTLDAINLLPILMAVTFFLQQKYTPKPPAQTPEQEQQQKMMQWMSLLFPVFLYRGPAGLNLYIMTSTAVGIFESKRIRDHIKERDEAEKAGRVFVETTRKMRRGRGGEDEGGSGGGRGGKPKSGGGGLAGWLADLQAKAEEMRKQNEQKKK